MNNQRIKNQKMNHNKINYHLVFWGIAIIILLVILTLIIVFTIPKKTKTQTQPDLQKIADSINDLIKQWPSNLDTIKKVLNEQQITGLSNEQIKNILDYLNRKNQLGGSSGGDGESEQPQPQPQP